MIDNSIFGKLKTRRNKTALLSAIALIVLLASSSFAALPLANAHNPPLKIQSYAFLVIDPNPVGVGQTLYVEMWIDLPPPTANGVYGDRYHNMTVTMTMPNGNIQTLGPFTSDDEGGADVAYVPTMAGNYTFVFNFPAQLIAGANMGPSTTGAAYINDTILGSQSAPETITVQSQTVTNMFLPNNPLPTGYWQNPVEAFNRNWNVIDGNWLGMGAILFGVSGMYSVVRNYNPYTTAATSSHIVWTLPEAFGGNLGGEFGSSEQSNYYTGFVYENKFNPIVINGILYYTIYPGSSTSPEGWNAVNLRTGQVIWTKNTTAVLMCGQVYDYNSMNQYGGLAYLWDTHWNMYDAMTGNWILGIVGAPGFGIQKVEASDGSILAYYTSTNYATGKEYLNLWNSSKCILAATPGYYPNATPINTPEWRPPQGNASIPWSLGVEWSVPVTTTFDGNPIIPALNFYNQELTMDYDDHVLLLTNNGYPFTLFHNWEMEAGFNMTNGQMLWITNRTLPLDSDVMITMGAGYYVEYNKMTRTLTVYNDTTGVLVWGPSAPLENSWAYYDESTTMITPDGNLYTWTLGGWAYDFNVTTGQMIWQWNTGSSGENTPYGTWPLWDQYASNAMLGGGVLYIEGGHGYGPPMYSGCDIYALNATTGNELWQILSFSPNNGWAIADGYVVSLNGYDNQIYCYGKGLTATTVSAPQASIDQGHSLTITGSVTDQSPGQTGLGIPAAGTPAVSDSSMTAWMDYMYMQSPCPANATGVPVTLSVLDPNGNTETIGTTVTDMHGNYGIMWTPPVPGLYQVTATFAGTNSYFSSSATTYFSVEKTTSASAAPVASPSPAPASSGQPSTAPSPTASPTTTAPPTASPSPAPAPSQGPSTEIYIIAAAAAVIIIVAAAAVILRRRTR